MRLLGNLCLGAVVKICSAVLMVLTWCAQSCSQDLQPEVVWAMPTSARIKCVTTVPGKMTVEYGTTPALGMTSPPEWRDWPNDDVTRHYVNLVGLQPSTTYYYRVRVTPQGGGSDLVSDVRSFTTFRRFSKVLPTVRYSSYLIGSDWSSGDTNKPYHDWNASHFDVNIAYSPSNSATLKSYNPDAICLYYENITNRYWGGEVNWANWAEEQGVSQERIALHYAVDSTVSLPSLVNDRGFDNIMLWILYYGQWKAERLDYYNYHFPTMVGGVVEIGLAQRFDVVYINLSRTASGGYDGVWEYSSAVDSEGKPTQWSPLTIVEDTTVVDGQKFAQSGYIRFVPPKARTEWKRARPLSNIASPPDYRHSNAGYRLFLVRFRVTQSGTNPIVTSSNGLLNEDFVKGSSASAQTIPGWDVSWETNPANNGDPEYNPNPPTEGGVGVAKSARFKWWSRAWYYRPELRRYMTNVFDQEYLRYYRDYLIPSIMQLYPAMDGWYCDNYDPGVTPGTPVQPSTQNFIEIGTFSASAYGGGMVDFFEECSIKLAELGKISCANNFIYITSLDRWSNLWASPTNYRLYGMLAPAITNREMSQYFSFYYDYPGGYSTFATHACEMEYRYSRGNYVVPIYAYREAWREGRNTEDWWLREKEMALAFYLLQRDLQGEYLHLNAWHQNMFYGEYLLGPNDYYIPNTPKQKAYYVDAATHDFGVPIPTVEPPYSPLTFYPGSWKPVTVPGLFIIYQTNQAPRYERWDGGTFYGNTGKAMYIARRYTKALVVWRIGTSNVIDDRSKNEYTEFDLGGTYYRLRGDGRIETTPVTRLNLREKEAAILIPAASLAAPNIQLTVSVDKPNPKPLDVVTVTIEVRNRGQEASSNVSVRAPLASDATFIQGSLKLDNSVLPDPPVGASWIEVTIPTVPAGQAAVVRFQFVVKPRN